MDGDKSKRVELGLGGDCMQVAIVEVIRRDRKKKKTSPLTSG